jgi:hypothetical protein
VLHVPNGQLIAVADLDPRPETYIRYPASGLARGRAYLLHGITATPASGFGPQGAGSQYQLTLDLIADGWECILAPYPEDFVPNDVLPAYTDLRDDPGLGTRWLNTSLRSWDNLVNRVTSRFGWMPSMVVGVSWGGLKALRLAAARSPIAYVAHVPVTKLGNGLTLLGGGVLSYPFPTPGVDAAPGLLNSLAMPGYVRAAIESATQVTTPQITSQIVQSAINAGCPLASRTVTDGAITGGTTLTSTQVAFLGSAENGAKVTCPGNIPTGTTISGISGSSPGPWTCTLSQASTNGTGLTVNFPNLPPSIDEAHTMSLTDVNAVMAWLQATVDPSYPARY